MGLPPSNHVSEGGPICQIKNGDITYALKVARHLSKVSRITTGAALKNQPTIISMYTGSLESEARTANLNPPELEIGNRVSQ